MKVKCIVSNRVMLGDGKFQDFKAGEVYEMPEDQDLGGNFVELSRGDRPVTQSKQSKGGKSS